MKFTIKRATLKYPDGTKDFLEQEIETDNLELVRSELKSKYNCEKVYFKFEENEKEDSLHG